MSALLAQFFTLSEDCQVQRSQNMVDSVLSFQHTSHLWLMQNGRLVSSAAARCASYECSLFPSAQAACQHFSKQ